MRMPLAILLALLSLALAGCSCSGPTGVSLAELEKTVLKGLSSPIDCNSQGEFSAKVDDFMIAKGFRSVVKRLPDAKLPDGSTVSTIQSCFWNAVVLDAESVPPEHRGKTAHFFFEQVTTEKKGRTGTIRTHTEAFRWELPAKE